MECKKLIILATQLLENKYSFTIKSKCIPKWSVLNIYSIWYTIPPKYVIK